ncbi:hypothetical protein [Paenibacillus pinihumi]|uniref:hypothetical protein n=1 Tax=Paenibacillus pinihumi TaxID=669462 RepID=UPI00048E5F7E|nr:hypothetical protein [Paenibacillus pinihumi]
MSLIFVLVFAFSAFSATAFAEKKEYTGVYTHPGGHFKVDYYFFFYGVYGALEYELYRETPNGDVLFHSFYAGSGHLEDYFRYGTWYYYYMPAGTYKYKLTYPAAWPTVSVTPSSFN